MCIGRDEDDINDVTSMAGVNLSEESACILRTNSETVGTIIRSWPEELLLSSDALQKKILEIGKKANCESTTEKRGCTICNPWHTAAQSETIYILHENMCAHVETRFIPPMNITDPGKFQRWQFIFHQKYMGGDS